MVPPPSFPRSMAPAACALVLAATAAVGAEAARRTDAPNPARATGFAITGGLQLPTYPGASLPLDLELRNPHGHTLRVTRISVELVVDAAHTRAGCDRQLEFRQVRMPARAYPIRLRPRQRVRLSRLGLPLPRVVMLDRPVNQDACKGARLHFRYAGVARRWDDR